MIELRAICQRNEVPEVTDALRAGFTLDTLRCLPSRATDSVRLYATAAPSTNTGPLTAWLHVRALVSWLDAHNESGPHETAMRLMKLTEETGEVMAAYIGMTGQNPRKGITHTADDVTAELCDVILTAMTALHSFTDDPEAAFAAVVRTRSARLARLTSTAA
ncbi:MazG-like family protein [Actinacidiphila oryziradicis]|uniref:Uncharacterized protein n=1 Tax=Actinacidiphila oryziradicis TaxID=2571141 RepID=A0A4U0RU72_9ACTN|nr:MazG-like family protein [Actinacidiphila oryziradicis]TJZ99695.1 hypothetical protein FCI23_44720 [Actinacidiphila oryziradicis]